MDFSQYKPSTLRRRILRRMVLNKMETIADLPEAPGIRSLRSGCSVSRSAHQRDFLLPGSGDFRVSQERRHPGYLEPPPGDLPIRVWVPGCATGEEAYSIAMLLIEAAPSSGAPLPVQIFASDISKQAIQSARDGRYPENIAADVSPERLQRFFAKPMAAIKSASRCAIFVSLRCRMVTQDPPFSRMDLISCRNLLIYLGVPLQKKVLAAFHYCPERRTDICCWEARRAWRQVRKRSGRSTRSTKSIPGCLLQRAGRWSLIRRNWRKIRFGFEGQGLIAQPRAGPGPGSRPYRFVAVFSARQF